MRIDAILCLFVISSMLSSAARAADAPNVLVLLTDDQQADAIHALGNSDVHTPNMDRLVERGFAFRRAYCMGSTEPAVCLPSRAMILSGRSLYRVPPDLKDVTTLPQAFRQAGYTTFGTGKWHNGQPSFAKSFDIGKSVFFGGMSNQQAVPVVDLLDEGKFSPRRIGDQFSSEIFADAAVDFLKQHDQSKPFFAWVAFTSPHDPRTPPADVLAKYEPARLKLPENCLPEHPFDNGELKIRDEMLAPHPRTPEVMREHLAAYYGMITHLDAQIGRILAALDAAGATARTIVVLASDHGLALGRHGLLGKQNLYEHSMRAPLVFAGPGVPRGSSQALAYLFDIGPTVCDLAGVSVPQGVQGHSLRPVMTGTERQVRDEVFLTYRDVQRALVTDRWKLIWYPRARRLQVFDLEKDPLEQHDLSQSADFQNRIAGLIDKLASAEHQYGDPLAGKDGATPER